MSLSNITSPAFNNRSGMGSKRIIHRMVFVRHGESITNQKIMNNTFNDKPLNVLNTPLSSLGQSQAQNVSDYLMNIGFIPDKIIVSRLSRAVNTAKPFVDINVNIPVVYTENMVEYNYSHDERIMDDQGEWVYKKETNEEFIGRVSSCLEELTGYGSVECPKQTLLFAHSQVISSILTNSIFGNTHKTNTFFHFANGSITCIDVDESGNYHVQAVNYAKHLDNPTGQHSPFV
jgi:broad specificity phosphatase PhoE